MVLSFQKLENAATLHSNEVAEIIFYTPTRNAAILALTPELLNSEWARFPADLLFALGGKIREQAQSSGSDVFRVTDAHGSDFTGRISYRYGFKYVEPPKQWQFFPGGDMAELPDPPVNGTLVFEQLEGFAGLLSEPIRLTIEEQWITRVEGGKEARWFEEQMKRYENGHFLCEVAVGVHPKAPLSIGLKNKGHGHDRASPRRHVHCGVGKWANPDAKGESGWHWDGGGLRPTFTVGDVELIRAGRLTRWMTRRFGSSPPATAIRTTSWPRSGRGRANAAPLMVSRVFSSGAVAPTGGNGLEMSDQSDLSNPPGSLGPIPKRMDSRSPTRNASWRFRFRPGSSILSARQASGKVQGKRQGCMRRSSITPPLRRSR